jgi:hypothetical protein
MNVTQHVVDVGKDFTRYPAGRTSRDGPFSGERFRELCLRPLLDKREFFILKLDSALGYGSSFLEEAFGGLVRLNYPRDLLFDLIRLDTENPLLKEEIEGYIRDAK